MSPGSPFEPASEEPLSRLWLPFLSGLAELLAEVHKNSQSSDYLDTSMKQRACFKEIQRQIQKLEDMHKRFRDRRKEVSQHQPSARREHQLIQRFSDIDSSILDETRDFQDRRRKSPLPEMCISIVEEQQPSLRRVNDIRPTARRGYIMKNVSRRSIDSLLSEKSSKFNLQKRDLK